MKRHLLFPIAASALLGGALAGEPVAARPAAGTATRPAALQERAEGRLGPS